MRSFLGSDIRLVLRLSSHRLIDGENSSAKELMFLSCDHRHIQRADRFSSIPGSPIAYWASGPICVESSRRIRRFSFVDPRQGLATADDGRFLRYWYEVEYGKTSLNNESSRSKWLPFVKGGKYRKWYGNLDFVINWELDGKELKDFSRSVIRNPSYYFRESVTWTSISSSRSSFRFTPEGCIFGHAGPSFFGSRDQILYVLALCNSSGRRIFNILSPQYHLRSVVAKIPVVWSELVLQGVLTKLRIPLRYRKLIGTPSKPPGILSVILY